MFPHFYRHRCDALKAEPLGNARVPIHFPRRSRGRRSSSRRRRRAGTSTVEFAIVAPVVILVFLALIQFASLLMSQNVITAAAREGGRVASLPGTASSATVVAAVNERLTRGGIDPNLVTVSVTPAALESVNQGDDLLVSVSAPVNQMGWIWAIAPPNASLSAEITYERE